MCVRTSSGTNSKVVSGRCIKVEFGGNSRFLQCKVQDHTVRRRTDRILATMN